MSSQRYDAGLAIRRAVLGEEYVDAAIAGSNSFNALMQEFVTEYCWGAVWTRPGLERKTRSLLNIAMLTALGKTHELKLHVQGAVRNGCTQEEIAETLLQAAVYAGVPAGVEGFRVANEALAEDPA